jgi:AraC-like DNA-binding protein
MTEMPDKLTETTRSALHATVVDEILASLRLTGGVVVDAQARGEWCMISQFSPEHCAVYFPVPGTLIGYHYIREGELWAEVEGVPPVRLRAGSVIVFPRNDKHLLYSRDGVQPIDADDLLKPGHDGQPATIRIDGDGPVVEIYCGFLGLSAYRHPLFDNLPPMLVLDEDDAGSEWIASSMRFLSGDQGSVQMIARLAEAFVGHAIRRYLESESADHQGWIAGLRDPAVARALAIIHRRYAEELDIDDIARESGVSRTVLGERFAELIGEPPMRYCARWRMRTAANLLRDGAQNNANIAYAVGFNSEAAFNRAFKREFGEPPATWKRHQLG